MPYRHPQPPSCALVLLALLAGCGGEGPPPPPRVADRISVDAGGNQTGSVGTPLPTPVRFLVADAQGPMAGVTVSFLLGDQSGFLSAPSAVSSATGTVSVNWTLGGQLGIQTLSASIPGAGAAVASATAGVGPVALLTPVSNPNQFAVVGATVSSAPSVRVTDAFGNPIEGAPVTFLDPTGRSTLVGAQPVSNAAGLAGITSWTLGQAAGSYSVVASAGQGATTNFVAFGIPSAFEAVGGGGQTANAGTQVGAPAVVRALDAQGQPLAGVTVTFTVTGGGGLLLGSGLATTGTTGFAQSPAWVLGPTPGLNTLTASVPGVPAVDFVAQGVAAVPAAVAAAGATSSAGIEGNFGSVRPEVRVTDGAGKPVAGVPVGFAVSQGGGSVSAQAPLTDFDGRAAVGFWRFGTGSQGLAATVAGLPPVAFTATTQPPPPSGYQITVRFIGTQPSPSQVAAFADAAARWSALILGDLSDEPFTPADDLSFCGGQSLDETIDDLLIFAQIETIDGPGGILGQAGACYLRDANLLSVVGIMRFDVADVVNLETSGRFRDVVLHEMGHVIGIGSLWNAKGLITGRGTGDPYFTGPAARMAFAASSAGPAGFSGNTVPVENSGGGGTRDVHWRETILNNELMTGFLNTGTNPLSAITVASLGDEGYLVNDAVSDSYSFGAALRAAMTPVVTGHLDQWTWLVRTRAGGRTRRAIDLRDGPFRR